MAEESYLLKIPAELRLNIYDYTFTKNDDSQAVPAFLAPLLTCRLIYQEAHQLAFNRAYFTLRAFSIRDRFFAPAILRLPHTKRTDIRTLIVLWGTSGAPHDLIQFFFEMDQSSIRLDKLIFNAVTPPNARFHELTPRDELRVIPLRYGQHIIMALPPLANVQRVFIGQPHFEYDKMFDVVFGLRSLRYYPPPVAIEDLPKDWTYIEHRTGNHAAQWSLELLHNERPGQVSELYHEAGLDRHDAVLGRIERMLR
ncbi:hypothetical protein P280DRAFT_541706 [Massarina eburnea CBS 473.64]|uniref:F-box domain-containing protein n=1 Tax=Massarina eburnea CBS 473.64 TaxID=1395130 RepID=A0A6A6S7H3_9PLEO|nr:hypothetical protein P280DRAFT_541706 [Massarina eburnea CBS 473.64]